METTKPEAAAEQAVRAPVVGESVQYHYPSRGGPITLAAKILRVHDAEAGVVNLMVYDTGDQVLDVDQVVVPFAMRAGAPGQLGCWSPLPR